MKDAAAPTSSAATSSQREAHIYELDRSRATTTPGPPPLLLCVTLLVHFFFFDRFCLFTCVCPFGANANYYSGGLTKASTTNMLGILNLHFCTSISFWTYTSWNSPTIPCCAWFVILPRIYVCHLAEIIHASASRTSALLSRASSYFRS